MNIIKHEINGNKAVTIENNAGLSVTLCALGAGIASIKMPDRDGIKRELTKLSDQGYGCGHNGLTTGRTAGRIQNATFTIDGKTAVLEKNNHGTDNLHGGATGLHKKVFDMTVEQRADGVVVAFAYDSPDGEGGYFGNIRLNVVYTVYADKNVMELAYDATADVKTLLNVTNHVYLNASGDLRESVKTQQMYINASRVGKLDERLITREIIPVPRQFDFRHAHAVGEHLNDALVQEYTRGYDHPFFLDARSTDVPACSLYSELSGIKITVSTTYPCAVVYGDNFGGYNAVCFECQFHPDGIHACPNDCGILSPEQPYKQVMLYKFDVE